LRVHLGVATQLEFARRTNLPYQTYRQWECFDAAPSAVTLIRALQALDLSEPERLVIWIATGDGDPPSWLTVRRPK
jgi:transcriptional regulator with XRE-family HTH domain